VDYRRVVNRRSRWGKVLESRPKTGMATSAVCLINGGRLFGYSGFGPPRIDWEDGPRSCVLYRRRNSCSGYVQVYKRHHTKYFSLPLVGVLHWDHKWVSST